MKGFLVLAFLLSVREAEGLGRTLADCEAVAAKFKNTCDTSAGALANVAGHAGTPVTCDGVAVSCAGTFDTSTQKCTWNRKMCATCTEVNGVVRIRVQSNGLPLSCYASPRVKPLDQDNDFEVDFNPPAVQQVSPETQSEVNDQVCDIQAHRDVPAESKFTLKGSSNMNVVAGIALDGVAYMNHMSALGVDPFYPSVYGQVFNPAQAVEKVDLCLGHPQAAGIYHYHSLSPCIADPTSQSVNPCNAQNGCNDFAEHSVTGYKRELMVIGIAKDGHVMYGPYLSNGEEAGQAGLDVCNGAVGLADCDDSYAYFATKTFPYLAGCFGSGNRPQFTPQCSDNAPTSYKELTLSCGAKNTSSAPATGTPPVTPSTDTPATGTPPTTPSTDAPATGAPPVTPSTNAPPATGTPPNMMIFMPDDYLFLWDEAPPGDAIAVMPPTPNMDRVRREGAVFQRAYTAGPKCAPSRFSLLTGRYSSRGNFARMVTTNQMADDPSWDGRVNVDVPTAKMSGTDLTDNLPTLLAEKGYATIHSGKWHLFATNKDDDYLADYASLVTDIKKCGFTDVASAYVSNMINYAEDGKGNTWTHNYEWMVNTSLTAVGAAVAEKKPFFLYMTPTGPHAPKHEAALFDFSDKQTPAGLLDASPLTTMRSRQDLWDAASNLTQGDSLDLVAGHMWVDDALGAMLQGFADLNVLDNTIVVICMDHGIEGKSTVSETGTRIMQAVRYPPAVPAESVVESVVANTDTSTSLLALAGLGAATYTVDGTSWSDEVSGKGASTTTQPKVMEMLGTRAVVAGSFKYYDDGEGVKQLYDLAADPTEADDLAADADYLKTLVRMIQYMDCHDSDTSALDNAEPCTLSDIDNDFGGSGSGKDNNGHHNGQKTPTPQPTTASLTTAPLPPATITAAPDSAFDTPAPNSSIGNVTDTEGGETLIEEFPYWAFILGGGGFLAVAVGAWCYIKRSDDEDDDYEIAYMDCDESIEKLDKLEMSTVA